MNDTFIYPVEFYNYHIFTSILNMGFNSFFNAFFDGLTHFLCIKHWHDKKDAMSNEMDYNYSV